MSAQKIIIDCDPGQDDAVNLLLALACPELLQVLGITTVAGNVPLALTQRNARIMCDLAGRDDVPVFAGCERPLVQPLVTAENVHGKTGIDGVDLFEPALALAPEHAVDFLIDTLRREPAETVTLVPTGPLTNIAMAFVKAPDIVSRVARIVLMGGALREGGNHSPSAEFNILVDPHAAHVVMACGRPVVVMGLDVTHQVLSSRARIERIRALDNRPALAIASMLDFFARYDSAKYQTDGAPLHDPCTVAWLLQPQLFSGRDCNLSVEIHSPLTLGHTAVDLWQVSGKPANVHWVERVDADGFYQLLCAQLARY